jgi:hypothetical protein
VGSSFVEGLYLQGCWRYELFGVPVALSIAKRQFILRWASSLAPTTKWRIRLCGGWSATAKFKYRKSHSADDACSIRARVMYHIESVFFAGVNWVSIHFSEHEPSRRSGEFKEVSTMKGYSQILTALGVISTRMVAFVCSPTFV